MQANKVNWLLRVAVSMVLLVGVLGATEIQVAPATLNIQNNGTVVTVHTDLPFSLVSSSSVTLNGILIQSYKADARGNFVAKFNISEVKDLVTQGMLALGQMTLTLEGYLADGTYFSGSQTITVVDILPRR